MVVYDLGEERVRYVFSSTRFPLNEEALSICLVGSRIQEGKVCVLNNQIFKLYACFQFKVVVSRLREVKHFRL
jgi:hypothetical protein